MLIWEAFPTGRMHHTSTPEIIYTMSDVLDIKFGAPFSLTSDGQDYAAVLELTYRF